MKIETGDEIWDHHEVSINHRNQQDQEKSLLGEGSMISIIPSQQFTLQYKP